jgi:hypothetical protein
VTHRLMKQKEKKKKRKKKIRITQYVFLNSKERQN